MSNDNISAILDGTNAMVEEFRAKLAEAERDAALGRIVRESGITADDLDALTFAWFDDERFARFRHFRDVLAEALREERGR